MALLTRKKALAAVVQVGSTIDTAALDTAANAAQIVLDLESNLDVERIERNLLRSSITSVKDLPGQIAVDLSFGVEMKGTTDGLFATGFPLWSRYLQACGFREVVVQSAAIGAITATGTSTTFRHGETITSGGGATATVIKDAHNGTAELLWDFTSVVGAFANGDTVTGSDSGAQATFAAAPVFEGGAWHPVTDPTLALFTDAGTGVAIAIQTGDVLVGETSGAVIIATEDSAVGGNVRIEGRVCRGEFQDGENINLLAGPSSTDAGGATAPGTLMAVADTPVNNTPTDWPALSLRYFLDGKSVTIGGARGNVVFQADVNRQMRMNFTFRGVLIDLTDRPIPAGIQYDAGSPPLWETSQIGFAQNDLNNALAGALNPVNVAAEKEPCLSSISIDMGNELIDRKCAGATNGLLEVRASNRDATGTIDPEDAFESDLEWLTGVSDGRVNRLSLTVGTVDGNRFTICMPGVQFTEGSGSDREGIATQDMSFRVTGGDLFDLLPAASTLTSIGGDNELILVYHTA